MSIKPFWISADLRALDIPGTNTSFGGMIMTTQNTVNAIVGPIRSTAIKAQEVNMRLKTWYNAQVDNVTQPITDLTNAAASFVEDVWATGVHAYVPMPELGGYSYLRRSLTRALSSNDQNAPMFSDTMETGGVLLMVAGGQLQVFTMAATIAALMGGNKDQIMSDLMAILTESSGLGEINNEIGNLARMPAESWNDSQKALSQWWNNSPLSKMADPDTFPASLLSSGDLPSYDPPFGFVDKDLTLIIKGSNFNHRTAVILKPASGTPILYKSEQFTIKGGKEITLELPKGFSSGPKLFTLQLVTMVDSQPRNIKDLGALDIRPGGIQDTLANAAKEMGFTTVFDSWKALSAGAAANALVPGAVVIADQAVSLLDNAGAAVDTAGGAITGGADAAGSAIVHGLDAVADVTDKVGGMAAGFLNELGKLAVGVLVIPPAKGGVHQLNWALNQGLSEYALNAPLVDDDMAVAGVFLCAGAPSGAEVMGSLRKVGTVFGIRELETL